MIELLKRYLRPYKGQVILLIVFQMLQAILNLYLPNLQADIINNGIVKTNEAHIYSTGWLMIGISVLQIGAAIVAVVLSSRISTRIAYESRRDYFASVENFSLAEIEKFSAGSLITRSTNDVQQIQRTTFQACLFVLMAPVLLIGGFIMAFMQNATLSWSLAVILPVIALAMTLIFGRLSKLFKKLQDRLDKINLVVREQISGIRVIRAFVREKTETHRFATANRSMDKVLMAVGIMMSMMEPIMYGILNLSNVVVMWFGGKLIESGGMQIGSLQAFLQYLMVMLTGFMMAAMMSVMLPRASVASKRILEVIDTKPSIAAPEHPYWAEHFDGKIEFKDVSFTYPGESKPVLSHISFTAEPGQTTAFIGSTGSGKSTILRLAQREYDVSEGQVLVDGHDVREFDPAALATLFGPVPQKAMLFTGTIRSNMKYGKHDATDEEIWQALHTAQAESFVKEIPTQLDAPVAEGGTNFSGGQKQRLCIARALVRDPKIYSFDDSFSALDMATDRKLREALVPVVAHSTLLLVAQRASTIRNANKIIVLGEGGIVGQGTHDELMETCETYRQIVDSQGGEGPDIESLSIDDDEEKGE